MSLLSLCGLGVCGGSSKGMPAWAALRRSSLKGFEPIRSVMLSTMMPPEWAGGPTGDIGWRIGADGRDRAAFAEEAVEEIVEEGGGGEGVGFETVVAEEDDAMLGGLLGRDHVGATVLERGDQPITEGDVCGLRPAGRSLGIGPAGVGKCGFGCQRAGERWVARNLGSCLGM